MPKQSFKLPEGSSVFYDMESGLKVVGQQVVTMENYIPGKYKKIDEFLKEGGLIKVTEEELEGRKSKKKASEAEAKTFAPAEPAKNPLLGKSKEEMIIWAESSSFVDEEELEKALSFKKKEDLFDYLTKIWEANKDLA